MIITFKEDILMPNYSKQREAILNELKSRYDHPTAKQVYEGVRNVMPNISLGTVYRNLSALVESGEIISVSVGDGFEHFDGNRSFHLHQHCKLCGAITDVKVKEGNFEGLSCSGGFSPENSVCVVFGICKNCNKQ